MTNTKTTMSTTVTNLSTGATREYSLAPREAVMAAFAQGSRNDWNTWAYETVYGARVEHGERTVICGDWCAPKEATS